MTKISELLAGGRFVSVELWPPRTPAAEARLESALTALDERVRPAFCSITYGAGGSTRERTHDLVVRLQQEGRSVPMAHLVCEAHSRADLVEILSRYRDAGVDNVLALKGDPPLQSGDGLSKDEKGTAELARGELTHASELVELAKSVGDFCVAVAAHPEGHPDSPDRESDRRYLAEKLAVADFAITQFFFRTEDYLGLVEDLDRLGSSKPVLPGIMPITNPRTLSKMAAMSGCVIPEELASRIDAASDRPEEISKIGIEVATTLGTELLAKGAPGLHFYTMNLASATIEVCQNLGISVS
ncbi:MAG: methylenetetrahydrofolate reductase [Acidimicrobiales bacterium]